MTWVLWLLWCAPQVAALQTEATLTAKRDGLQAEQTELAAEHAAHVKQQPGLAKRLAALTSEL